MTFESRPGPIEIEFQLTWAERRAAAEGLLRSFRKALGLDKRWRALLALCAGLIVTAVLLAWLAGATGAGIVATLLAGSASLTLAAGHAALKRLEHKRIAPLRSANSVRQSWRLDPEGLWVSFRKSRLHLPWSDVRRAHHVGTLTLVFIDETLYLIVPDRAFLSAGHRQRFQAYLKVAMDVSHPRRPVAKAA